MSFPQDEISIIKLRSSQKTINQDSSGIIWYEDFENGLAGNNNSINPLWTTGGDDGDIWEHDFDGSNGQYNGSQYTIESESTENGWMIFDADSSNEIYPVSAYQQRIGHLTSPYIDLSNDTNVSIVFSHAYRYCCYYAHEISLVINDGSGWDNATSFKLNEFVTVNDPSGTETTEIIISEIVGLKDSIQIRFDWGAIT